MNQPAEQDAHREDELDQLLAEYYSRVDAGQATEADQLAADHPTLADELRELIGTSKLVDELAGPALTPEESTAEFELGPLDETLLQGPVDRHAETITTDPTRIVSDDVEELVLSSPHEDLPRRLGGYVLLSVLGRGGMGVVYKARQISMNRTVAVKMIASGRLASEEDLQRFYTEAHAAGKLGHGSIVSVHQVGEAEGHHFFSMDYIDGPTLADLAGKEEMTEQRAARLLAVVADAIGHAHEMGIVHRDLKPANVLVDDKDQPHITDFGLAKLLGDDSGLTATGTALGTPSYMSPEQATGRSQHAGPATDIYAIGAILYALLTGRPPFRGQSVAETIIQVSQEEPLPPRAFKRTISRDLETICMKCLAKEPEQRYATAADLKDDLERFLRGEAIHAKPVPLLQRSGRWLLNVPIVAAVTGRRLRQVTPAHRWANAGLVLTPLLLAAVLFGWWSYRELVLPAQIRIASAQPGGMYHDFAEALAGPLGRHAARSVEVLTTSGSVENEQLLRSGTAHLALLQTSAVLPDEVSVVAPLYDDLVHIVVRRDASITTLADLAGHRISLGLAGSGMRLSGQRALAFAGLDPNQLDITDDHFTRLLRDDGLDGAIVTTGPGNADLRKLLSGGEFRLLPVPGTDNMASPVFHPRTIPAGFYRAAGEQGEAIPPESVGTIGTTTFLAVPKRAPAVLVTTVLEELYLRTDLVKQFHLLSVDQASEWTVFDLHPSARQFFATSRSTP